MDRLEAIHYIVFFNLLFTLMNLLMILAHLINKG